MRLIEKIKVSAIGRVTTSSLLGVTFLLAVTLPYAPLAMPTGDTICGDVAPSSTETISTGTLTNVIVPSPFATAPPFSISGKCKLEGSVVVQGNVTVEPGATLETSGVTINGNVKGESGLALLIDSSTVGGNVQTKQMRITVTNSIVGMNIQTDLNDGGGATGPIEIELVGNNVGGNVQLTKNVNSLQDILVNNNSIGGNLQLKDNTGKPLPLRITA